jgi:hypothetical protein
LYVAELLAILVQNEDENRKLLGELGGIDILLQQIAVCYTVFQVKFNSETNLKISLLISFTRSIVQAQPRNTSTWKMFSTRYVLA